MSWPRRGAMVNSSWPKRRLRRSETEAGRVDHPVGPDGPPGGVAAASPSTVAPDVGDVHAEAQLDAGPDRFGGEGDARAPRADDRLVGDGDGARRPAARWGSRRYELVERDPGGAPRSRWPGPWRARRPAGPPAPRPRPRGRPPSRSSAMPAAPRVGGQQLVAAPDQGGLEASRLGVEPGVHNGRVGLGGAGADVVGALQHHGAEPVAGQLARDGGADHTGPDDRRRRSAGRRSRRRGEVPVGGGPRRARSAPGAPRPRRRRSSARSGRRVGPGGRRQSSVRPAPAPSRASAPTPAAVACGEEATSTGICSRSACICMSTRERVSPPSTRRSVSGRPRSTRGGAGQERHLRGQTLDAWPGPRGRARWPGRCPRCWPGRRVATTARRGR